MITTDFDTLISTNRLILAEFYADWCGPCRAIRPSLERLVLTMSDRVSIIYIDTQVYEHLELVRRYNIVCLPTLMLFMRSECLWRESGVIHYDRLCGIVHRYSFVESY